jgi:hypothetical protein
MVRIKIEDLPRDLEIEHAEMRAIGGGFTFKLAPPRLLNASFWSPATSAIVSETNLTVTQ